MRIAVSHISKRFETNGQRAIPALRDVSLEVQRGELLALLGPSGSGKTTLLRIIAGLEIPDAGQVTFIGEDVTEKSAYERKAGFVFQAYALFQHMNVFENIAFGLRVLPRKKRPGAEAITKRVTELLQLIQLEGYEKRMPSQLSGGQRQRVALARALAVQPRALLLDEPLTSLDAQLRETLRVEINLLLRRLGITTIYVTHDQTEAMALGDRIIVMSHGRVAQAGTPREIYHQPASAFVADFIGTMNRLQGEVKGGRFLCAAGTLPWAGGADGVRELLFRPEDVRLADEGEDADLSGTIAAAFFVGDRTRLFVEVSGSQLVVDSPARCSLQIGQPVRLRVDSRGLLAL
jgi:putative spermidine/putrescine transport system ATP-binding protein